MFDTEGAAREPTALETFQADKSARRPVPSAKDIKGGAAGPSSWYVRRHSFDGVVDRIGVLPGEHARKGGVGHDVAVRRHGAAAGEGDVPPGVRRKRANTMPPPPPHSPAGDRPLQPPAEDQPRHSSFSHTLQGAVATATTAAAGTSASAAASGEAHQEADRVAPQDGVTPAESVEVLRSNYVGGDASSAGENKLALSLRPLAGRCSLFGCGKVTVYRCHRCRSSFYCSRDHQRGHWEKHRAVCEEGKGSPPPPLARLVLPPPPPPPPSRSQTKAVGWADSTQLFTDSQPPSYDQVSAASAVTSSKTGGSGQVPKKKDGGGSAGGRFAGGATARARGAGSCFQQKRSHLEAAISLSNLSNVGGLGDFDPQPRTSSGGTSWTVPSSNDRGDCGGGGSAEVWPLSSSATATNGAGLGAGHRGRSVSPPPAPSPSSRPPPPPPLPAPSAPPPPPTHIPPPASRPSVVLFSSLVDMLLEMGFESTRAKEALRVCDGSVERATEWLLTEIDTSCSGDDDAPGDAVLMQSAESWSGSAELRRVVGETGVKRGGKDCEEDLITTTDPTDVGQGFDMTDFWRGEDSTEPGSKTGSLRGGAFNQGSWGVTSGLGIIGEQGHGGTGGDDEAKAMVEDDDGDDLIASYEDFVGGSPADIVVYYRQTGSATTGDTAAAAAAPSNGSMRAGRDGVATTAASTSWRTVGDGGMPVDAAFAVVPGAGEGSARGIGGRVGDSVGDAKAVGSSRGVLTVVVRSLPSTAPASLDSDSSRGEDTDRNDHSGDTEHVVVLPWEEAENLAFRHLSAQRLRSDSAREAADVAGIARDNPLHPSAWPLARQPSLISPLSPPPSAAAFSPGSRPSPSWRRKNKVGRLIAGMLERRADGGFEAFAAEASKANRSDLVGSGGGRALVLRAHERPRGRALPKWGRHEEDSAEGRPPPRQPPPPPASKWGSVGSGLGQAWNCEACTFFNENPAFRTACEICSTPRPSGGSSGVFFPSVGVDWQQLSGEAPPLHGSGGAPHGFERTPLVTSTTGLPSASAPENSGKVSVADPYHSVDSVTVGGSEDDEAVDGILGGVSPGGGTSPVSATAIALQEPTGNVGGLKGIDWEGGAEWQRFGDASFGESP